MRDGGPAIDIAAGSGGDIADFLALMKPRVMSLVVFTALVGLVLAPDPVHPLTAFTALLCIAAGAGASGALNMWYDADIDARMRRTAGRPIPTGRVTPEEALGFGAMLAGGSVVVMGVLVNWVAAALLALTIGFYLFVYTMWLKRRTPQNIVIGGASGALPPMIGWAAVTGDIAIEPVALFAVIFLWTPAHFWALALYRAGDYERAGVPMMPAVRGGAETRTQILGYAILTSLAAFIPLALGTGGTVYGAVAAICGILFIAAAWRVYRDREGRAADTSAMRLFAYSIFYLFALFATLLGEVVTGAAAHAFGL